MGTYGVDEVQRDASGRVVSVLRTLEEPRAGDSIQLTIDLNIQREAQRALNGGCASRGCSGACSWS